MWGPVISLGSPGRVSFDMDCFLQSVLKYSKVTNWHVHCIKCENYNTAARNRYEMVQLTCLGGPGTCILV